MIGGEDMYSEAKTPEDYLEGIADKQKDAVVKLRDIVLENLPAGFEEKMSYGMIGYVVPKSIYPEGYKANPNEPLPFAAIAAQKNHIALYHMGVYMFPEVLEWFESEYDKNVKTKLDMGKSCIRFKNPKTIPYDLIGKLFKKITAEQYIDEYKRSIDK
jgi:uncharacterized protein YdhG (YjbR/CyaY superfamily)